MRKIVSIQKISKIIKHDNADTLEIAQVLGWFCVVKKGEYKEGQHIVFFEIDSFLPIKPEYEFLRKGCHKKYEDGREGFRIKTIRLRGVISQGLIMPFSILPQTKNYELGEDVSEILEVVQWNPPIPACLKGKIKGNFPSFLAKTDETRIQIVLPVVERYKGTECYVTEKIDGASATYFLNNDVFGVCSRNLEIGEDETAYWEMARKHNIEEKLRIIAQRLAGETGAKINLAIQGEIFGLGLQGNPLSVSFTDVRFYNLFFINTYTYASYPIFTAIMEALELPVVPILEENYILESDLDTLIKKSVGKSVINPKKQREGIVIRPIEEVIDLQMSSMFSNGRFSFKVINPEFLLENE